MCSPALGDTLLFSAALQDLRAAFPQAHITHVCMRQNLAAAEFIPGADRRLLIDLTDLRRRCGRCGPSALRCCWISRAGSG